MTNKPKTSQKADTTKVSQMDVCQTPPHALEPLYPYIPKEWIIWESAAGPEQLIVKTLHSNGYDNVIATDLLYGQNYFTYEPEYYDIQLTNMPFTIKYKWLERAFKTGQRFALLAPYETTFAKEFQKLFNAYNYDPFNPAAKYYIEVLSPERRINYKMPNKGWGKDGNSSAQMPTCWITWGLDVSSKRNDHLRTFYVPMRSVRYDSDNSPIERIQNVRKRRGKEETR